jgi:hypothetical protein
VGRQLGRLGPLTGRQVFLVGRTHLSGEGREPGRWGPTGTHVSQAPCNTPCFCSVVICANDTIDYSSNYP